MLRNIPLSALHPDPRNPNVCHSETLDKIAKHIERTGLCPYLIVRPHPTNPDEYYIVDGHHRLLILKRQGRESVECQVWDIDEKEAALMLASLNRLRGTDDFHKRAELLQELSQNYSVKELELLVPESAAQIEDMLATLHLDMEALEDAFQKQTALEESTLPVPLAFVVSVEGAQVVEKALEQFKTPENDRGEALVAICKSLTKEACDEQKLTSNG